MKQVTPTNQKVEKHLRNLKTQPMNLKKHLQDRKKTMMTITRKLTQMQ